MVHSLVRALVHSQLDYCNGALAGMFQYQIDWLQSVFFAPRHALSSAYPSGPAFRTPWTTNYTGSPSQEGLSSNSVASSTNVYTTAHHGICLNTTHRSIRSLVVHTWDLQHLVICLYQPPAPRQSALVDSSMLVQQLGTVFLFVWRNLT